MNAQTGEGSETLLGAISKLQGDKRTRSRGPLRLLAAGLPNVGKSSLVNRLSGAKRAPTGAAPGITRGEQWIRVGEGLQLLDLPGIITPTIQSDSSSWRLLVAGIIGPTETSVEDAALQLVQYLAAEYPDSLRNRYGIKPAQSALALLEHIGKKRGCVAAGGGVDWHRTSNLIINETRRGLLGRLSLELPET